MKPRLALFSVVLTAALAVAPAAHARELLLASPGGGPGADPVVHLDSSSDGRTVMFFSSDRLTAADTDSTSDVYVSTDGVVRLVSTGATNDAVQSGKLSRDGSRAFFDTRSNLAESDGKLDVYVSVAGGPPQLVTKGTALDSVTSTRFTAPQGDTPTVHISDDGAIAVQTSPEALTASDDDTGFRDVYAWVDLGAPKLLSPAPASASADEGDTDFEKGSPDLRHVVFQTIEELASTDSDALALGGEDLYMRDVRGTAIRLVSREGSGNENIQSATACALAADGTRVAFNTPDAAAPNDNDDRLDAYLSRVDGAASVLLSDSPNSAANATNANCYGASADGRIVLMRSDEALTGADTDTVLDLYSSNDNASPVLRTTGAPAAGPARTKTEASVSSIRTISDDGQTLLVVTSERWLAADEDTSEDIYLIGPAGLRLLTSGTRNDSVGASVFMAPGGRNLVVGTNAPLMAGDTSADINSYHSYLIRGLGPLERLGPGTAGDVTVLPVAISDDGERAVASSEARLTAADTDVTDDIYVSVPGTAPPGPAPPAGPPPAPVPPGPGAPAFSGPGAPAVSGTGAPAVSGPAAPAALSGLKVRARRATFVLSGAARVSLRIERRVRGRRSGRRCVKPARRLRSKPRCTRSVRVKTIRTSGRRAGNSASLGRLSPGRYRLTATPARGRSRSVGFSVS